MLDMPVTDDYGGGTRMLAQVGAIDYTMQLLPFVLTAAPAPVSITQPIQKPEKLRSPWLETTASSFRPSVRVSCLSAPFAPFAFPAGSSQYLSRLQDDFAERALPTQSEVERN